MEKFLHPTGRKHRDKGMWAAKHLLNIRRTVKPLPSFDQLRTTPCQTTAICNQQSAMSDMSAVCQLAGIFTGIQAGVWKETNCFTSKFKLKSCSLPDASTSFWLQDKSSKQRSTRRTWPTSVATAATPKSHRRLWCRCRVLTLAPPSLLMGSMAVTCRNGRLTAMLLDRLKRNHSEGKPASAHHKQERKHRVITPKNKALFPSISSKKKIYRKKALST